ncbi:sulfatase-like hydrolase/transferase [Streptomyces bauhiniae]|uniref:sulfatase-like hydrolase/transferase n=1 Tax=Streptomyces bauhiniae TaxID=2340725 RepID=UPI00244BE4EB|nr:sulfatase-like hydrolase/transferase [Streptomyces bauhiniae]
MKRHRLLGVGAAALLLAACSAPANTEAHGETATEAKKPNIVFVLTDDLATNLVQYMPHVQELQRDGTSFSNYFVTDSLCCPSRSSILTGKFPHNTGVFTNNGDDGGYGAYNRNGNERDCYGPALQKAGYRTGFMGKYLNGYLPADQHGTDKPYVPPGWDEWDVAGNGYPEFNYDLNENGKVVRYGHDPEDYLTDVVSKKATSFIDSSAAAKKPFVLELATFAPHRHPSGRAASSPSPPTNSGRSTASSPSGPARCKPWTTWSGASATS